MIARTDYHAAVEIAYVDFRAAPLFSYSDFAAKNWKKPTSYSLAPPKTERSRYFQ